MTAKEMRYTLEWVTNVALLIVCASVVFVLAGGIISVPRKNESPLVRTGETFPQIPTYNFPAKPEKTLVLAISANCSFCQASVPFYKNLASAIAANSGVAIVAILPEGKNETHDFVEQIGSSIPAITGQNFRDLHISGTPTLLLLDSERRVEKIWMGKLSLEQEQELLENIHRSGT
jgi:hypothetical protein